MASNLFGGGAGSYGVMASVMGLWAVGGGLISAARGRAASALAVRGGHRWGIAITAAAVAPTLRFELARSSSRLRQQHVQCSYAKRRFHGGDPAMRGRFMALWGLAVAGSTRRGPLVGGSRGLRPFGSLVAAGFRLSLRPLSLPALRDRPEGGARI